MKKTDAYLRKLEAGSGKAAAPAMTAPPASKPMQRTQGRANSPDGEEQEGTDSSPGWIVGYVLCLVLLFVLRLGIIAADSPTAAWWMMGAAAIVVLLSRTLRRAFIQTAVLVIVVSAVIVVVKRGELPDRDRSALVVFAKDVGATALGWGPGKQVAAELSWRRQHHQTLIQQYRQSVRDGGLSQVSVYSPYFTKVSGRTPVIRAKALELTKHCPDDDAPCEVAVLNRFVTEEIRYRADPRGGPDYIQEATDTLKMGAGDCEDQSILLASLLEAVGERTLLAFSPGHAYPVVCFKESLAAVAARSAGHARDGRYRSLVWSKSGMPTRGQPMQALRVDGDFCYPLEPTRSSSYVGVPHTEKLQALFDPVRGGARAFSYES